MTAGQDTDTQFCTTSILYLASSIPQTGDCRQGRLWSLQRAKRQEFDDVFGEGNTGTESC